MGFQFTLSTEVVAARELSVRLRIFDVRGREVATLPGIAQMGPQRITWDGRARGQNAPAGMYVARLEVGSKRATRKFVRLQ